MRLNNASPPARPYPFLPQPDWPGGYRMGCIPYLYCKEFYCMKNYAFEVGSSSDKEIVIQQPVEGFGDDQVIIIALDQVESFISSIRARANALKSQLSLEGCDPE